LQVSVEAAPSSPLLFRPQQYAVPSVVSAQVWLTPELIDENEIGDLG